ncbi:hypothetical protein BDV25DRAFT_150120 [Aspergillus avenaceus]|uniref:Uncharacterized protein n=1 Tax=Aspergillus avenaceus TaxID=36643 RepID=A0A5N6U382_ASPAV|nr:hypothetical protein BDV25DRAFT_150120 [Aspergillus avenaceus]
MNVGSGGTYFPKKNPNAQAIMGRVVTPCRTCRGLVRACSLVPAASMRMRSTAVRRCDSERNRAVSGPLGVKMKASMASMIDTRPWIALALGSVARAEDQPRRNKYFAMYESCPRAGSWITLWQAVRQRHRWPTTRRYKCSSGTRVHVDDSYIRQHYTQSVQVRAVQ